MPLYAKGRFTEACSYAVHTVSAFASSDAPAAKRKRRPKGQGDARKMNLAST